MSDKGKIAASATGALVDEGTSENSSSTSLIDGDNLNRAPTADTIFLESNGNNIAIDEEKCS